MSEDEKREIRNNLREAYRLALDDLRHLEIQRRQYVAAFRALADALDDPNPQQLVWANGVTLNLPPAAAHAIPIEALPTRQAVEHSIQRLGQARARVAKLEDDLRLIGERP